MKKGLLYIFVLVFAVLLSACGESQAVEVTSTPSPTMVQELSEPTATPTEEFVFAQDWHVCVTIEKKEGVYQALQNAFEGDGEPGQRNSPFGQQIEILHIARDGNEAWLEIYTWETLPDFLLVYPGDRVCDTILPRLQLEVEALPENIHKQTATPTS